MLDELKPQGTADISFTSGNFDKINDLSKDLAEKSITITKTIVPLIEVALIELLGSSSAFIADFFNAEFDFSSMKYSVKTQFTVSLWLGTDVPTDAIAADSKYILDRINVVPDAAFTRCEIDCTKGQLFVEFTV